MEDNKNKETWMKTGDIAAIIHIFYPDLIEEIAEKTRNLPENTDFYISIPDNATEWLNVVKQHFPQAHIFQVENRGRDILPFLEILKIILPLKYDLLVKIHSKKTLHRKDGTSWRQDVYGKILGSPEVVNSAIEAFRNDPKLGILGPKGHVLDSRFYMGGNKSICRDLLGRLGFSEDNPLEFHFVASTMFWARPEIFEPIVRANFQPDEFPVEPLPADGTLAHAMERIFGLVATNQGFAIKTVNENGELSDPDDFAIYQFTPAPKALALANINSLVYYPAYNEAYGIEHLRITAPYRAAQIELISGNRNDVGDPERVLLGDGVIFQREFPQNTDLYDKIVAIARQNFKPIIYELDDLLFDLPETHHHRLEDSYLHALLPMLSAIIEADLVIVPTKALKHALSEFNPNIQVLPNYLDDSLWQLREPKINKDFPITIGFMGSNSHTPDLEVIAPVIKDLLNKYKDKLFFKVIGTPLPKSLENLKNVIWQASPTNVYVDFAKFFQTQEFDIFVAPLAHNLFNSCKSNLKFLEYSALGVPCVYSKIEPYSETIEDGMDGFLAETEEDWSEKLTELILNPELRLNIALAAQEKVRNHWLLSKQIHSWQDIITGYAPNSYTYTDSKEIGTHLINTIRRQVEQHQKVLSQQNENYKHDNQALNDHIKELNVKNDQLNIEIDQLHNELNNIYKEKSWAWYSRFIRLKKKIQSTGRSLFKDRTSNKALLLLRNHKNINIIKQSELFDQEFYLTQNPDVKNAGIDPVKHYLLHGASEGRQPSVAFNGDWYLQANPDVKNAGINPLLHYLKFGRFEGRLLKPELDSEGSNSSSASVESEGYNGSQSVEVSTTSDQPQKNIPTIPEKLILSSNLATILQKGLKDTYQIALSHDDYLTITGGVQVYIHDEQKASLLKNESYLHLYPYIKGSTTNPENAMLYLGINLDGKALGYTEASELLSALYKLESKQLSTLSIHHSMGFSFPFLHQLLKLKANEKRFWLHDYYSLCPSYNLMRNGSEFCNGPSLNSNACLICKFLPDRRKQLSEFGKLIEENALTIVSPSRFTFEFWQKRFPVQAKQFKVIPPARLEWSPNQPSQGDKSKIRIGYLGYPLDYKGWKAWQLLTQAMSQDNRYKFFQFSTVPGEPGNYKTIETRRTDSKPNAMVEGLINNQIDVVLLWSVWPETFSFTLHEGLAAGAYVLTNPNSGNIQYYLTKNPERGTVLPDADSLVQLFESGEMIDLVNKYNRVGKHTAALYYGNMLEEKS